MNYQRDVVLPLTCVPLARAYICITCEGISVAGPSCPNCAGEQLFPLARWFAEHGQDAIHGPSRANALTLTTYEKEQLLSLIEYEKRLIDRYYISDAVLDGLHEQLMMDGKET